jgi:hypothetical protein
MNAALSSQRKMHIPLDAQNVTNSQSPLGDNVSEEIKCSQTVLKAQL